MIYIDASVVLAQLLAEDRKPPAVLWTDLLVTSRLTEYESRVRINSLGLSSTHTEPAQQLLSRFSLLELSPIVLARALEPFPAPVRTLDALHLASIEYLRSQRLRVSLASYADRMVNAAGKLGIQVEKLDG